MGDDDTVDLARLWAEVGRLRRERDALIGACILWSRRRRPDSEGGGFEGVYEWRVLGMGDTVGTRAEAVAAVRRAAGLAGEG
jgi:hypothetical protein